MKKSLLILSILLGSQISFAQKWVDMISEPDANLYEIQKEFYKSFEGKDLSIKSTGYKAFKRWEYFVRPRVYPSGDLSVLSQKSKNYSDFLVKNEISSSTNKLSNNSAVMSATWVPVGPMGAPTGLVGGLPRKAGRDNFVTFHPTNPAIIYAGAAGGGLWVTTNGGTSWTTNTDNLPVAACSDLAIDPTNPNIMYLGTGGGDDMLSGQPVSSDGVYKSIDGGLTWLPTGLTFSVSQSRVVHKVVLDPTNSQIVFVATNIGIFRSTNGGTSFTSVTGFNCWDLKFHPTNPTICYAAGTAFYRSTNGGLTFGIINSGIPTSGSNRMAIAVTPTNPTNVYVVASKSSDSQFLGFYSSSNEGVNFTTASTTPNIIGNSCAGTSTGQGQGWFDLAIAASPINPNEVVVGGVNVWRSTNGGVNWTVIGCWNSPSPYIHADIHELEYTKSGTLYSTNDGGIYSYNGSVFTDITAQRNIAQIYKIGLSSLTPNKWITGHQDNGTNIKTGAAYVASLAGDGMDCFIDRTNDNYMFAEQYNGNIYRSTNGGASWANISAGVTGTADWVTPWKQDPNSANTIYTGRVQLFKSTNYGSAWTQMGTTGAGGAMIEFAIAPSNSQVIYVLHPGSIRKTTNGGATWTNVTNGVPAGALTFITIDPNDENTAWVTSSGYTAGNKVYQTLDGGATWMNISSNLPNLPANCSVYEPGSNDRIYIGMDVGIYYKDNSSTTWTLYNTGLPNVQIMDLEMTPAAPGKIYAATYGRGVYEADVIPTTAAPVPNFSYFGGLCVGVNKTIYDNSTNTPTNWSWTITPSTGVTFNSTSVQNPTVSFTTPGTYTISFISGNSFGSGPVNTQTVSVSTIPAITLSSYTVTVCDQDPVIVTASGAASYTWSNGGGNAPTVTYTPSGDWTYTVTGSNSGCISTQTLSVINISCVGIIELAANNASFNVYPNPAIDNVTLKMKVAKNIDVAIEVYDLAGKLVLKQNANFTKENSEYNLNIANLSKGIYSLKVVSKEGSSQNLKIVKD
ncbi:T9SS type A sorting domain-containing protein [Sediminibacterium sp.]|uniref:T9SS type A sorting domain-containing protein n=1 Tax=Sediminibacterium sp. TaxID=1917865 RepID=UPI002723A1DE|nr:T9SS type A sorting domain-containing protein [Sediminibacterium sp.]MDO9000280.1 T9SS type A sorting domain-containing protein [Bacteroidota bacterium]MDP3147151.1 T9SS type A sorting domain-containing protein [Bacteroidota bacterium]MDP3567320.1 T9SS type A sorting domain-containing protein [Sediminibacterium sp.]